MCLLLFSVWNMTQADISKDLWVNVDSQKTYLHSFGTIPSENVKGFGWTVSNVLLFLYCIITSAEEVVCLFVCWQDVSLNLAESLATHQEQNQGFGVDQGCPNFLQI